MVVWIVVWLVTNHSNHFVSVSFKKIQDWILISENGFCVSLLNRSIPYHSPGSWRVKGTEESLSRVDSSVPLTHCEPSDLWLICLENKYKNPFSDLRIHSWISLRNLPKDFNCIVKVCKDLKSIESHVYFPSKSYARWSLKAVSFSGFLVALEIRWTFSKLFVLTGSVGKVTYQLILFFITWLKVILIIVWPAVGITKISLGQEVPEGTQKRPQVTLKL